MSSPRIPIPARAWPTEAVVEILRRARQLDATLIPHFPETSRLVVFSDYSGDHKESNWDVYSYFLTTNHEVSATKGRLHEWRTKHLRDNRRMSYKDLRDKVRARALQGFLDIGLSMRGLVCSVAVSKSLGRLSVDQVSPDLADEPLIKAFQSLPEHTRERSHRVLQFLSCIVSEVIQPQQELGWITDQDEIIGNLTIENNLYQFFRSVLAMHVRESPPQVYFLKTSDEKEGRLLEDLTAIPDLFAGALSESLSHQRSRGPYTQSLLVPVHEDTASKAVFVLNRCFARRSTLRELSVILETGPDGRPRGSRQVYEFMHP